MMELQCTIAHGACDSKDILGAGNSSTERIIADKISEIYFLLVDVDDPRISHDEIAGPTMLITSKKYSGH